MFGDGRQNVGRPSISIPISILFVADGLFSTDGDDLVFHEVSLTPDDIADTQDCIRKRVLKYFGRQGWFDKETIEKMASNENSGFSLDAKWDRKGLERLIRYCARPCFASENLRWNGPWLYYRLPKPTHTGKTFIQLDPLEFIERISCFIPYPRRHQRHYHGAFAPNSTLREKVAASAQKRPETSVPPAVQEAAGKVGKIPEFDPAYDLPDRDICQLIPWTEDGFPQEEVQITREGGPDPPLYRKLFRSSPLE